LEAHGFNAAQIARALQSDEELLNFVEFDIVVREAVALWARDKGGMISDDAPWADPSSRMRLRAEELIPEPSTG
jgi:hypothetical protein